MFSCWRDVSVWIVFGCLVLSFGSCAVFTLECLYRLCYLVWFVVGVVWFWVCAFSLFLYLIELLLVVVCDCLEICCFVFCCCFLCLFDLLVCLRWYVAIDFRRDLMLCFLAFVLFTLFDLADLGWFLWLLIIVLSILIDWIMLRRWCCVLLFVIVFLFYGVCLFCFWLVVVCAVVVLFDFSSFVLLLFCVYLMIGFNYIVLVLVSLVVLIRIGVLAEGLIVCCLVDWFMLHLRIFVVCLFVIAVLILDGCLSV